MKTITVNRITTAGNEFKIRQAGYHAELTIDEKVLNVKFNNQWEVLPFIAKFVKQFPFVNEIS